MQNVHIISNDGLFTSLLTDILQQEGWPICNTVQEAAFVLVDRDTVEPPMRGEQHVIWIGQGMLPASQQDSQREDVSAYIRKPFKTQQLFKVLHTALAKRPESLWHIGALSFSPNQSWVASADRQEDLTSTETALLLKLCQSSDGLARQALLESIGYVIGTETHTLESHLYRLRKKLQNLFPEGVIVYHEGKYRLNQLAVCV